jgi:hypothetical protein
VGDGGFEGTGLVIANNKGNRFIAWLGGSGLSDTGKEASRSKDCC